MKKIVFIVAILVSTIMADSVLLVKKGWQLIGSSTPLEDMSKFKSDSVEQVWHFDAKNQKWLGYSPDSQIQAKISDKNISQLDSLKSWHGFWVKSKKEWSLLLDNSSLTSTPSNQNSSNDIIQLKKGWNLISLPVDSVVSADIFGDMTVWKYNEKNEWELFDKEQSNEDFPKLAHIKNSDGLWVKAPKDINLSVMEEASKLHNFNTKKEMEEYIKEITLINNRPYCGIEPFYMNKDMIVYEDAPIAVASEADNSIEGSETESRDASTTNLQESGVDESDIVKHDGTNIFYTSNNSKRVDITTFSRLADKNTQPLDSLKFNQSIDSLYLRDNRLIVISKSDFIGVDIFDVSNIDNINLIDSYKIDGSFNTSRVIGDNLYIVSSFTPQIDISYPKIEVDVSDNCKEYFEGYTGEYDDNKYVDCFGKEYENGKYYRYDYDAPIVQIKKLMPNIESNKIALKALIEPSQLYAPSKYNQTVNMITITNISIVDGEYKKSNSFIGYSSTQYASSKALYLVSSEYPIYYDFNNYKERSTIYKFNLDDELSYRGLGSVYGTTINQFSLSEYNDILRIATTEGFSWWSENKNNSIYTLKEQNQKLSIEGVLSGLGKEGESIKSVRFMGNKGYVVTFRQTDPFYTIDMSDPTAPRKVGELQVNGYSSYLHPIGEDRVLGFGRDANSEGIVSGVKIELFDISDFANPSSLDSIVLGQNTYSQLEDNHKALAFRNSDNLFAFPYQEWDEYSNEEYFYEEEIENHNYLGVYQIENDIIKKYTPISNLSSNCIWSESRGLIFDINSTTYVSFFSNGQVITEELKREK